MNSLAITDLMLPYQSRIQKVTAISAFVATIAGGLLMIIVGGNFHNLWSQAGIPLMLTGGIVLINLALFAIVSCLPKEKNLKDQIDRFFENRAVINQLLPQPLVNLIGSYTEGLEPYFLGCPMVQEALNKAKEDFYHLCTYADEIGSEVGDGFSGGDSLQRVLYWQTLDFDKREKILRYLCAKKLGLGSAIRLLFSRGEIFAEGQHQAVITYTLLDLNDIEGAKLCCKVYNGVPILEASIDSRVKQETVVEYVKCYKSTFQSRLLHRIWQIQPRMLAQFLKLGWVNVLKEIFYDQGQLHESWIQFLDRSMHDVVTGAMLKRNRNADRHHELHLNEYLSHLDEGDHIATIQLLIEMGVRKNPPGRGAYAALTPFRRAECASLDPVILALLQPDPV